MSAQTLLRPRNEERARDAGAARKPAKTASGHGPTWTNERIDQLKRLLEAGLTCSQIAAEVGVSRNAVIGKITRLGLSRRKEAPARAEKPKLVASRTRALTRIFARRGRLIELAALAAHEAPAIAILDGRGCSLFELAPGKCRWPINDPGAANFCFCGSAQLEGLPYCLGHARLAYRSGAGSA
jgi:GcrA cell cycle regulator